MIHYLYLKEERNCIGHICNFANLKVERKQIGQKTEKWIENVAPIEGWFMKGQNRCTLLTYSIMLFCYAYVHDVVKSTYFSQNVIEDTVLST